MKPDIAFVWRKAKAGSVVGKVAEGTAPPRFLQDHLVGIREHAKSFVPITGKPCSWPT